MQIAWIRPGISKYRKGRALAIASVCVLWALGGCATRADDAEVRGFMLAFADTSAARVSQQCNEISRKVGDNPVVHARLNREKLLIYQIGMDNATNPRPRTGLLDMMFQYEVKLRGATSDRNDQDTDPALLASSVSSPSQGATTAALMAASTARDEDTLLKPWSRQLNRVHLENREELWKFAGRAFSPTELKSVKKMIHDWLADHPDVRYSKVKFVELRRYEGDDPDRSHALSLVDLRETNEQVDRSLWMAQRMPDVLRLQAKQLLFDLSKSVQDEGKGLATELGKQVEAASRKMREETQLAIRDAGVVLSNERQAAIAHATDRVDATLSQAIDRAFSRTLLLLAALVAGLGVLLLLHYRFSHPPKEPVPPWDRSAPRGDLR